MVTHIFAWICGAFVLAMAGINGVLMMISPRLWFRLPRWAHANARFTVRDAESLGGALQIRLLGAVFVAFVLLLVVDLLLPTS